MTRLALVAAALCLLAGVARAEPYFAAREGYLCSQCHLNKTGGGKRNQFGVVYSQTVLPLIKARPPGTDGSKPTESGLWFVDPRIGSHVSVGAEFRVQNVTTFGYSTVYDKEKLSSPTLNTFKIGRANLFAQIDLIRDRLALYVDENFGPEGASSREAFVLLHNLPLGGYVKAGRLLLPFGLRLPDDSIFVREITGYNYTQQDLGVEVGAEPGPFFVHLAAANGTGGGLDINNQKHLLGTAGVHWKYLRAGFSYAWNNGTTPDSGSTRRVMGGFAAFGLGRVALLAEAAWVRDWTGPGEGKEPPPLAKETQQWVLYAELNVLPIRGVNLKLAYDHHDPDLRVDHDNRERFTFAADVVILPFLRFGAYFYLRRDIPQRVSGNQNILLLELHGYL